MARKTQITIQIHKQILKEIEGLAESETRGNRNQMIEIIFENYLGIKNRPETIEERDERLQQDLIK